MWIIFKDINDTYGHHAGDTILIKIAQTLTKFARRGGDFAARMVAMNLLFY